jgi:hypothetical protein
MQKDAVDVYALISIEGAIDTEQETLAFNQKPKKIRSLNMFCIPTTRAVDAQTRSCN